MSKFLEGYLRIIRNGRVMTTNPEVLLEILQAYCLDAYMRDGDIYDDETQEMWLSELFKYMGDEKAWERESRKAIEFVKLYSWDNIASQWVKYL